MEMELKLKRGRKMGIIIMEEKKQSWKVTKIRAERKLEDTYDRLTLQTETAPSLPQMNKFFN